MKVLKRCVLLMLALVIASNCFAAVPSVGKIQKQISKAHSIWPKDPAKGQDLLNDAFQDAIYWTRGEFVESIREKAFYLAVKCVSPALITETMLAADTYLKIFPKGRYKKAILLRKALGSFASKDYDGAEKALNEAEKLYKRAPYKLRSLRFDGMVTAGKHRSAEKYLEGSYLKGKDGKTRKDLRRFHKGNRYMKALVNKIEDGKISPEKAVGYIETAIRHMYFAKDAPKAAIISEGLQDRLGEVYHPLSIDWCGLTREVHHTKAPQFRLHKYLEFIKKFPEAKASQKYLVLQKIRNIYLYEMRDKDLADQILGEMDKLDGYGLRARAEKIFSEMTPEKMITPLGNKQLAEVYKIPGLFPYDNGVLPIITQNDVNLMLAISDMAVGVKPRSANLKKVINFKGYADLPVPMLYFAATGQKSKAWEIYSGLKQTLSPQINKMFDQVIDPLYLPARTGDRLFFAALAASKRYPFIAINLIHQALKSKPRIRKNEHALAVLADMYQEKNAYSEAQMVWKMLRSLHPQSMWLK
jgi:tetratricopeptide (TPR) repeat protein